MCAADPTADDTPQSTSDDVSTDASESRWRRVRRAARRVIWTRVAVDTRSLAAVRIGLAGTLLVDLGWRAGSLKRFYTDAGVYPLAVHEAAYGELARLSLHALSGAVWVQWVLVLLAAMLALAFGLGYRTRLTGALSLLLLLSVHVRNPAVLNGGDRLLRVLFVVALATPLGERWSVDALRRGSARERVATAGTTALLAQPLVVFAINAVEKHAGSTWYGGDALAIALANAAIATPLGAAVADHGGIATALTYGWVVLLVGAPVLLLAPVGRYRLVSVAAYLSAFVGMALSVSVGVFPLALTTAVLAFVPTAGWETLARHWPSTSSRWRPSPSALGPLVRQPVGRRVLGTLRQQQGGPSNDASAEPTPAEPTSVEPTPAEPTSAEPTSAEPTLAGGRVLATVFGWVVLAWLLVFAAGTVGVVDLPDRLDDDRVNQQRWGLYAPDPTTTYSWYTTAVRLANGSTVRVGDERADRPPDHGAVYPSVRHRKFMSAVGRAAPDGPVAIGYADWACGRVAVRHDAPVERITVVRVTQEVAAGGPAGSPTSQPVIERPCAVEANG